MGSVQRSIGLGFVLILIVIPVILHQVHESQVVLSASIHKVIPNPTPTPTLILTPTPIPTLTPMPYPTDTPTPTLTPIPTANPQDDAIWDRLAECESHRTWTEDTGNSYYGGLQFSQGAWESVGGVGKPSNASREEQIAKGKLLQTQRGWSAWSACSRELKLE